MTNDHIKWTELCQYLQGQPGSSAPKSDIPQHLQILLSDQRRRERARLNLVYYAAGWGWRLRRDWKKRLETNGS